MVTKQSYTTGFDVGSTAKTAFTSRSSGTDYTSYIKSYDYYPDTPVSGSLNPNKLDHPILYTDVTLKGLYGVGKIKFRISDDPGGGDTVLSEMITLTSTPTDYTLYVGKTAFRKRDYYYGLKKYDAEDVYYKSGANSFNQGTWRDGNKISSESIGAKLKWSTVPSAPTNISMFVDVLAKSATLTWGPPEDNGGETITGYRIMYKKTSESSWKILASGSANSKGVIPATGASTSATIPGLSIGTKYDFKIGAINKVTDAFNTSYTSTYSETGTNGDLLNTMVDAVPIITVVAPPIVGIGQTYAGSASATLQAVTSPTFTYSVVTTGFVVPTGYTAGLPAGVSISPTSSSSPVALTGTLTDTVAKTYIFAIKASTTVNSQVKESISDPYVVRVQYSRPKVRKDGNWNTRGTVKVRVGGSWKIGFTRVYDETYISPWDGSNWRVLE